MSRYYFARWLLRVSICAIAAAAARSTEQIEFLRAHAPKRSAPPVASAPAPVRTRTDPLQLLPVRQAQFKRESDTWKPTEETFCKQWERVRSAWELPPRFPQQPCKPTSLRPHAERWLSAPTTSASPRSATSARSRHPGYVDYYVYRLGERAYRARAQQFVISRVQDTSAMCDVRLRSWIKQNNIELVNFRDALYGSEEYQNHLKATGGDLVMI
jgi:hypothetical protein